MCKLLLQTCYYIATLAFLSLPQVSIVTGFFVCLFVSLMNLSATAEKGKHNLTNKERLREFAPRSVQNSSPASFSHLFRPNKNLCCDCF